MSEALKQAAVAASVAAAPTVNLQPSQVSDIAANLPPGAAMESLGPQLLRYAVSAAGSILVGHGLVGNADWQVIGGAIIAVAPVIWRIGSTFVARRKAGI